MGEDTRHGGRGVDFSAITGTIWFIGWLFTVGLAGLPFWRAVLALVLWPYFLGVALR